MNGVLVTFLVVLGAGFAVLLGFAISHRYFKVQTNSSSLESQTGEQSQTAYMQHVRERTKQDLMDTYGGRYALRPVAQDVMSHSGSQSHY